MTMFFSKEDRELADQLHDWGRWEAGVYQGSGLGGEVITWDRGLRIEINAFEADS